MNLTTLDDRKVERLMGWREKVRQQAAENALTLFVMAGLAAITWAVIIITGILAAAHGN
jgi:hypothetical protein